MLRYKGDGEIIGRSVSRNSELVENVTNAKIILKKITTVTLFLQDIQPNRKRGSIMDESYDFLDELENFLGATFHQDIRSPEHALDEFIEEISKEGLLFTVKYCEEFLNSD